MFVGCDLFISLRNLFGEPKRRMACRYFSQGPPFQHQTPKHQTPLRGQLRGEQVLTLAHRIALGSCLRKSQVPPSRCLVQLPGNTPAEAIGWGAVSAIPGPAALIEGP